MSDMIRREFITLLGGVAAWPLAARAQQAAMPVIGWLNLLSPRDRPALLEAFRQGLNDVGYVEGRNVAIEYRWAEYQAARLATMAADLVNRRVEVIVATGGNVSALAAKAATTTIPTVFTSGIDPEKTGLVTNPSRPEGNLTGISWFSSQLTSKGLGLLHELAPSADRIALLVNPSSPEAASQPVVEARAAAHALGKTLLVFNATTVGEIDASFASLMAQQAGALVVHGDSFLSARRHQIVALAARHAIPAIYFNREFVEAGGLMSYGNNIADAYRKAGVYTARILKGAKPADLPVDRASKFELIINLNAAKSLGLEVPNSMQLLADEVIE
jgi:putative ABC transport system substrate-binding protein